MNWFDRYIRRICKVCHEHQSNENLIYIRLYMQARKDYTDSLSNIDQLHDYISILLDKIGEYGDYEWLGKNNRPKLKYNRNSLRMGNEEL